MSTDHVADFLARTDEVLSLIESKTRHVRDSAFWGAPVGTPLPLARASEGEHPGGFREMDQEEQMAWVREFFRPQFEKDRRLGIAGPDYLDRMVAQEMNREKGSRWFINAGGARFTVMGTKATPVTDEDIDIQLAAFDRLNTISPRPPMTYKISPQYLEDTPQYTEYGSSPLGIATTKVYAQVGWPTDVRTTAITLHPRAVHEGVPSYDPDYVEGNDALNMQHTIIHEWGHGLDNRGDQRSRMDFDQLKDKEGMTPYGLMDTSGREAFAEAWAMWVKSDGERGNPWVDYYADKYEWVGHGEDMHAMMAWPEYPEEKSADQTVTIMYDTFGPHGARQEVISATEYMERKDGRHVRDADYWGAPVGTPLPLDKPREQHITTIDLTPPRPAYPKQLVPTNLTGENTKTYMENGQTLEDWTDLAIPDMLIPANVNDERLAMAATMSLDRMEGEKAGKVMTTNAEVDAYINEVLTECGYGLRCVSINDGDKLLPKDVRAGVTAGMTSELPKDHPLYKADLPCFLWRKSEGITEVVALHEIAHIITGSWKDKDGDGGHSQTWWNTYGALLDHYGFDAAYNMGMFFGYRFEGAGVFAS
jgi:hypothetical protein